MHTLNNRPASKREQKIFCPHSIISLVNPEEADQLRYLRKEIAKKEKYDYLFEMSLCHKLKVQSSDRIYFRPRSKPQHTRCNNKLHQNQTNNPEISLYLNTHTQTHSHRPTHTHTHTHTHKHPSIHTAPRRDDRRTQPQRTTLYRDIGDRHSMITGKLYNSVSAVSGPMYRLFSVLQWVCVCVECVCVSV